MPSSRDVPLELYLTSPNGQQKLGGLYRLLEGKLSKGLPIWKRIGFGQEAWIYSGPNGRWYVSNNKVVEQNDFQCGRGLISSLEHRNLLPVMLEEDSWQYKDQYGWNKDLQISFSIYPPPAPERLYITSPNGFQKLSGEYQLSTSHANGHPLWQRAGWGEEAYLYSGRSGKWYVVCKQLVVQRNFECNLGGLVSSHPHAGLPPDAFSGSHRGWGIRSQCGWEQDEDIRIGTHPFEAPSASLWVTSRGLKATGRFDLLEGQFANGFPLWRCAGLGAAMWLFSGNKGKWCISDHTAAEQYKFRCNSGFMLSEAAHVGLLPEQVPWSQEGGSSSSAVSVTTKLPAVPEVMYLISPNGQQRKAGTYQLVDTLCHGYPVWKSSDGKRLLYTGNDGRWYFGGINEVTVSDFNCASGVVCSDPHGGVLPHEIGCWQLWSGEGWLLDEGISVWLSAPKAQRQLYLVCRNGSERLAGMYALLEGQSANSLPLWKREGLGEDLYLYSGSDGKWHVGDEEVARKGFDCDLGSLCSCLHGAAMPNMLPSGAWERCRAHGRGVPDSSVAFMGRLPEYPVEISILSPAGQQKVAGRYLLQNCWANGQPIWKRMGHGEELWMYSGTSGYWHVAGVKAVQKSFCCTLGNLATAEAHGGLLPFQAGQWQLRDADGWRDDGEVKVLQGPLSFPPVLYLVTEHSDAIYELVAEFLNGQPLWKCSETGKESWLYSTTDGFWCLSKKDYPTLGSGCSLGTLASLQPHGGSMPHLCEAWQVRSSSGWETSGALLQTNPPESPSVLHVEAVGGGWEALVGKYWRLTGELIHHRHLWRQASSKEGPILFSTPDGWLLQTSNPLDESTLPQLQVTALQRADMLGTYQPVPGKRGCWKLQ